MLKDYALKALKGLATTARKTKRVALGKRLQVSAQRAAKKMNLYIEQAMVQLNQLPNTMLLCPELPSCVSVDNTDPINQYTHAIRHLRAIGSRSLNRGSRLVASSVAQANKITARLGRNIKRTAKQLLDIAATLPKTQSVCAG
jgi:hypothetical protein